EFLTDRGRNVTVVEESGCMGAHMAIPRRWRILHELRERGVCFITNARVESLENGKACFIDENRKMNEIKFDSVILAKGTVPNTDLYKELSDMGFDVHLLGDCRETAYIRGAIADGAFMGRKV
ncbi:MAG: FAD-dependent oxidoreductase, partial [bacterium]|nr:FAD-dependent oxidoreductase [bacterium]